MDYLQYSPNQKQHRGNQKQIQNQNQNYNSYAYNQQQGYLQNSYDEQGDYLNINIPHNQTNQNFLVKNSFEENKRELFNKNQHGQLKDNNLNISVILNSLNEELENLQHSNSQIAAEIEKIESNHSNLIAARMHLVEEVIEKKTSLILLKKEVEVMRGYLNSLLRIKKNKIEEVQKTKSIRLIQIIENINESTEILNEATADFKNFQDLKLEFLEAVNKEILINLIKNS
jgi:seryl-tRNA synthetase